VPNEVKPVWLPGQEIDQQRYWLTVKFADPCNGRKILPPRGVFGPAFVEVSLE
jgi:hypothetical protein